MNASSDDSNSEELKHQPTGRRKFIKISLGAAAAAQGIVTAPLHAKSGDPTATYHFTENRDFSTFQDLELSDDELAEFYEAFEEAWQTETDGAVRLANAADCGSCSSCSSCSSYTSCSTDSSCIAIPYNPYNPYTPDDFRGIANEMVYLGACFVATVAFGSRDAPTINTLRNFRDDALMKTKAGRYLVRQYYRHGPKLAAAVANKPATIRIIRTCLRGFAHVLNLLGFREPKSPRYPSMFDPE